MLLSIVVPVYREEKNIPEFLRRMRPILAGITEDYEIIFALDPSPDRTEGAVLEQRGQDQRIKLLKFSRRFGQPMATLAGMQYSSGDAVIVMDVICRIRPNSLWPWSPSGGKATTSSCRNAASARANPGSKG